MAEKIKMPHEQLASPLLPVVPVEKKKKKQKQARAFLPFPAVRLVCLWGLFNASVLFVTFAITCTLIFVYTNPCHLTEAEDGTAKALMLGVIWGTVVQAAAAAPALLLPALRRQTRQALANAVLAAAVASHCMYASSLGMRIYQYAVFNRICCSVAIFLLVVGDLICFLALVGSDE